ncbi:hypothetical protein [Calothrix rhizosoleniae]|nr:hypothetical protein [Calothrix rhizosoleniae]
MSTGTIIFMYIAAIACLGFGVILGAHATALKAAFDEIVSMLTIAPPVGF